MKLSLPLSKPRKKPQKTTLNTYTQHLQSSGKTNLMFLYGTAGVALLLFLFSQPIQRTAQKIFQSSSLSTSSAISSQSNSTARTPITLSTIFNQPCAVHEVVAPTLLNFTRSPEATPELWYKPSESCTIPSLSAIRVVAEPNFTDSNADYADHTINSISLLSYYSEKQSLPKIDLGRYGLQLAAPIVPEKTIFDTSKTRKSVRLDTSYLYLEHTCAKIQSACNIWRQDKITGKLEKIATLLQADYELQFASNQTPEHVSILMQKNTDNTEVITIDLSDPNIITRNTYRNNDDVLLRLNKWR